MFERLFKEDEEEEEEEEEDEEEEVEYDGFSMIHTDLKCSPQQANRASYLGPWGGEQPVESCLEGCKDVKDCAFVTMNKRGFCR